MKKLDFKIENEIKFDFKNRVGQGRLVWVKNGEKICWVRGGQFVKKMLGQGRAVWVKNGKGCVREDQFG